MLYEDVSKMHIDGACDIDSANKTQIIHASYDANKCVTKITCIADIVTVGIVVKYLQSKFDDALSSIPANAQAELLKAIEEVLIC